jgi:S1-C subfamily serine protease
MVRALLFATFFLAGSHGAFGQEVGILHVKVSVVDAAGNVTPVPRHALLISDDPPTIAPRRVLTTIGGTAEVRLRPGAYVVESDQPLAFQGKNYEWSERVEIAAGRDATLELTADNAEVDASATSSSSSSDTDISLLTSQWQNTVLSLWTPTTHASGFLIDAKGLIVTNQRVVGTATAIEVQLTPEIKVAASVLASDPMRDVAVLWVDPKAVASVRPLSLGCGQAARPTVEKGQEVFTLGSPMFGQKRLSGGLVSRLEARAIVSDLRVPRGSAGGPVFAAGGVVGITSVVDEKDQRSGETSRVVRAEEACEVVASAEKKMADAAPPAGTHLPVEPNLSVPQSTLKDAAQRRGGSLNPYQVAATDFDIAFITPVLLYGGLNQNPRRPIMEFGNWLDYVDEFPPVLLVRVMPKMVESLWATVARGAARTQGMALPPIKHVKSGLSRMRAFCGEAEVTPIHPFTVEQRISETDAVYEGLYVFDPAALGPHCGTVKFALYSEKEPAKANNLVVDPKVIERVWQDLSPYHARP